MPEECSYPLTSHSRHHFFSHLLPGRSCSDTTRRLNLLSGVWHLPLGAGECLRCAAVPDIPPMADPWDKSICPQAGYNNVKQSCWGFCKVNLCLSPYLLATADIGLNLSITGRRGSSSKGHITDGPQGLGSNFLTNALRYSLWFMLISQASVWYINAWLGCACKLLFMYFCRTS